MPHLYYQTEFECISASQLGLSSVLLECQSFRWYMASHTCLAVLEPFWTCGCGRDNKHLRQNLHLSDFSSAIWIPAFFSPCLVGRRIGLKKKKKA